MRLPVLCMTCFQVDGQPSNEFSLLEFSDNGRYEVICPRGHTTLTVLQQQKFEILFEIGLYAVLDGYYREAVSAFAASLERFYEYAVRVLMHEASSSDTLFQAYKGNIGLSERQLGAYAALWTLRWKEPATLLSSNRSKFRNDVIHKGAIPRREQAVEFGEAVFNLVGPALTKLRGLQESVQKITFLHLRGDPIAAAASITPMATMSIATFLNQNSPLADYLVGLTQRRSSIGAIQPVSSKPKQ